MHRSRILPLALILVSTSSALAARLVWMQSLHWRDWQQRAELTQRSTRFTTADRGRILDRYGVVLAEDRPVYSVEYSLRGVTKTRWVARRVLRLVHRADPAFPFDEDRLTGALERIRNEAAELLGGDEPIPPRLWIRGLTTPQVEALRRRMHGKATHRDYPGLELVRDDAVGFSLAVHPRELFAGEAGVRRLERRLREWALSVRGASPTGAPTGIAPALGALVDRVHESYRSMRDPRPGIEARLARLRRRLGASNETAGAGADERRKLEERIDALEAVLADPDAIARLRQRRFERSSTLWRHVPFDVVVDMTYRPESYPGLTVHAARRRASRKGEEAEVLAALIGRAGRREEILQRWLDEGDLIVDSWYPEHGNLFRLDDAVTFAVLQDRSHHLADAVGLSGLEAKYESQLRPRPGARNLELDYRGRPVGGARWEQAPRPGEDIRLTLDFALCARIYRWLRELDPHGACVVVGDPSSGEIWAWNSYPSFDPGRTFSSAEEFRRYANEGPGRFLDRPVQSAFPPGSIFKCAVALAGLAEGVVDPHEPFHCTGYYDPRQRDRLRCTNHQPRELDLDLFEALARSCNGYFYHLGGDLLGGEKLAEWGERLGIWRGAAATMPREVRTVLPGERTNGPMLGIGRGFTITPLGAFRLACVLARRGLLPSLRLRLGKSEATNKKVAIDAAHWQTVVDGMIGAVDYGTARWRELGLWRFDVAVKTGTAGTGAWEHGADGELGRELNQAWLIGFAPVESPRVAFAVHVERTPEHGGEACGPLAAHILRWLVDERDLPLELTEEDLRRAPRERGMPHP